MYTHAHLYSGSVIKIYWTLETLLFAERGKVENSQKSSNYNARKNANMQPQFHSQRCMTSTSGKKGNEIHATLHVQHLIGIEIILM